MVSVVDSTSLNCWFIMLILLIDQYISKIYIIVAYNDVVLLFIVPWKERLAFCNLCMYSDASNTFLCVPKYTINICYVTRWMNDHLLTLTNCVSISDIKSYCIMFSKTTKVEEMFIINNLLPFLQLAMWFFKVECFHFINPSLFCMALLETKTSILLTIWVPRSTKLQSPRFVITKSTNPGRARPDSLWF